MIVSKDINPERDVYYLGAKVIQIIDAFNQVQFDFFEVFQKLNKNDKVSVSLYVLTIDWLFLNGIIDRNSKGDLVKCF